MACAGGAQVLAPTTSFTCLCEGRSRVGKGEDLEKVRLAPPGGPGVRSKAAKECGDSRFLLPGSGGSGRSGPLFPPLSYCLSAGLKPLLYSNNQQQTVADFHRSFEAWKCAPIATAAPRSNGLDTIAFVIRTRSIDTPINVTLSRGSPPIIQTIGISMALARHWP
jgi:hypothetical protein